MEATRLSMSLMIKVFSYPFVRRSFIISLSHFYFISNHFEISFKSVLLFVAGLNIRTGHWKTSGKKLSYVRQKLLHNGHSYPARSWIFFINYRHLKTQKHLVSIGLSCSFYEHFNRHFYLCSFFNIQDCMIC